MQLRREISWPDKQWHHTRWPEVGHDRAAVAGGGEPRHADVIWSNGYSLVMLISAPETLWQDWCMFTFLANSRNRFSYPPQCFERGSGGRRACERCLGDLCECIDSYWDVTRAQDWGSTCIDELRSAFSRNGEYFPSFELIGECASYAFKTCNWHHLFHVSWVLNFALVWSEVRGRLLCEILHNPAFNSFTYKLAEKVPSKSFVSCWDAKTTLESHVTAFISVFQITGGNSIDSSWYNSSDGHAYGSWGLIYLTPTYFLTFS